MKNVLILAGLPVLVLLGYAGSLILSTERSPSSSDHGGNTPVEMDFELVGGRVYVLAEVGGHKTSAILDTGSGSTIMDLARASEWSIASKGDLNVSGTGSAAVTGKILDNATVVIGGITTPIPFAIPLDPLTPAEGRRMEVVVGAQFFQSHIVEVDYSKHHLRIFDAAADVRPAGDVLPINLVGGLPHIDLIMRVGSVEYPLDGMVDTGATGGALTTKFLKTHHLETQMTEKTGIGGGVGGMNEGRYFRPDILKLGSASLSQPVIIATETTGGLEGEGSKYDINIGSELLQRFLVTFDYRHKRIFLKANERVTAPFEVDKTGMQIYAEGGDLRTFRIHAVIPGTSSETAGISPGDIIETIDGAPASKFTLQDLRTLFRSSSVTKWDLGIRRGDKLLKVTVTAKGII